MWMTRRRTDGSPRVCGERPPWKARFHPVVLLVLLAAWILVLLMVGAIAFTLKWGTPFHTAKAAGWDFNVLLLVMALAIALMGPGAWAL